ncbi:MAG: hypothetical protein ACYDH3_10000 [Candidatus Aminicenantales bacterium]
MVKKRRALALLIGLAVGMAAGPASFGRTPDPGQGQDYRPPRLWERVEITLLGGVGIPHAALTTLHSMEAGSAAELLATAKNSIRTSSAPAVFAGAAAVFYLRSGSAVQAGFGYMKAGLTSNGEFQFTASGAATESASFQTPGEGELTAVPVFVCLYKNLDFRLGQKALRAHISLGPTLSFNSVLTSSRAGAPAVRDGKADGFFVPIRVEDTTWISIGATAGLGLDIPLSPSLALSFEARYFYAARESLSWTWTPGVYDGVLGNLDACVFDETAARRNASETTRFTTDPSFVQIAGGIKLIF